MSGALTRSFVKTLLTRRNPSICRSVQRNSHWDTWVYRKEPKPAPTWDYVVGYGLNAFAWWWILTHIWYQSGHLFGEFPDPEPSKWTDEELGVVLPEDFEGNGS